MLLFQLLTSKIRDRVSLDSETLIKNPLTSMTLVFRFCYMPSVRSTSDCRGPVTRKRVPDREEPGKPCKDARRGRCHPLEAGFWPLWMTPLPRHSSHKSQVTAKRNSLHPSTVTLLVFLHEKRAGPCLVPTQNPALSVFSIQ